MSDLKKPDEALANAYAAGARRYRWDPKGDPRGPYDGRSRLGKAWHRGWRDAYIAATNKVEVNP